MVRSRPLQSPVKILGHRSHQIRTLQKPREDPRITGTYVREGLRRGKSESNLSGSSPATREFDDKMDFMQMTTQQIRDLAKPTKEYEELLSMWPPMKVDWSNRDEALGRLRMLTELAEEQDEKDAAVSEEISKVAARDGYENDLWVFRSANASAPGPLVVLYHGGGCILGSPVMVADIARWLVKKFNAVVAAPAYRLAPEHVFPTSMNDAWDTFFWIAKNSTTTLKSDPSKGFIVGGISAGATMSIILAHLARDNAIEPKLTGVYSACGSVRPRDINDVDSKYRERMLSRDQSECLNNPVLSKEMATLMRDCYQADTTSKLFAPLVWPDGEGHKGFPRFYQQVCGRDPARDEAFVFEDILKGEGVETKTDLYVGLPHCFWIGLRYLKEGKRWEKETVDGFEWLLRA